MFRSGFTVIVGKPNVGKSTLFNALLDQKIAITSNKPQATRFKIRGIVTLDTGQIVFIDTPGFFKPRDLLGKYMMKSIRGALEEVDVVTFILDASKTIDETDCYIANELMHLGTPVIALLNKMDKVTPEELEVQMHVISELGPFQHVLPISAKDGKRLGQYVDLLLEELPEGPKYYPDDMQVDQPEKMVFAEVLREKIMGLTVQEMPYAVFVDVSEIEKRPRSDVIYIKADIFVERDSQKGIIIGEGGQVLKKIGNQARYDIERLLGTRTYLELEVKVRKNWRKDDKFLSRYNF